VGEAPAGFAGRRGRAEAPLNRGDVARNANVTFSGGQAQERQQRLLHLLAPIHDVVRLSARRLCRCNSEGDDLFQEAALRALLRIDDLKDPLRFRAWFYAVLLSVHRERSRRSFWRRFVPFLGGDEEAAPQRAYDETRGESAQLSAALFRLPAEQREAVVLFEVDGYSIEEIAEMQRASVTAVKTRLARGRQRLRQHYTALEDVEVPGVSSTAPLLTPRPSKEVGHGNG
jgi:RNA polymerase sigma-70 factor (ECF subfamily)